MLTFKYDVKRFWWLLDKKVHLLFSKLIAVATSERVKVRKCQLIWDTERYEPLETDEVSGRLIFSRWHGRFGCSSVYLNFFVSRYPSVCFWSPNLLDHLSDWTLIRNLFICSFNISLNYCLINDKNSINISSLKSPTYIQNDILMSSQPISKWNPYFAISWYQVMVCARVRPFNMTYTSTQSFCLTHNWW